MGLHNLGRDQGRGQRMIIRFEAGDDCPRKVRSITTSGLIEVATQCNTNRNLFSREYKEKKKAYGSLLMNCRRQRRWIVRSS